MSKPNTLFAAFNKLRTSLGFAAIDEDKASELSLDQEFIDKAQASIDSAATLKASVDQLTTDLATANTAKKTAEDTLATEKARADKAEADFKTEKTAHDKLKGEAAAATTSTQEEEDANAGGKKALNSWEVKAAQLKRKN